MVSKKAKLHQQCTKNRTLLFNTNHKSEGKKGKARCEIIEKEYFKTILVLLKWPINKTMPKIAFLKAMLHYLVSKPPQAKFQKKRNLPHKVEFSLSIQTLKNGIYWKKLGGFIERTSQMPYWKQLVEQL